MRVITHRVSYPIFGVWKHNDFDHFHQALERFMYFARNGLIARYELGTLEVD